MRRLVGIVLMVVALGCIVAGTAIAVLLGPDSRAVTGPHPMSVDGIALTTAPDVLSWAGPTVTVLVEVPDQQPVFVGVANSVDVNDYLRDTRLEQVDSYEVPWTVTTTEVDGEDFVPAAPTALDWWLAEAAGQGGAALTFRLPDETVSIAVIAVGDATLDGLQVTASYDVAGGFGYGLGLVAFGLGLGLFGWISFRRAAFVDEDWVDEEGDEDWDDAELEDEVGTNGVETPVREGKLS